MMIGQPLEVTVLWYDKVPEPPLEKVYKGEVVGWRNSQVIIRVKEYAVIRFWKKTGLEVGNPDCIRRGFQVVLADLNPKITDGPMPAL